MKSTKEAETGLVLRLRAEPLVVEDHCPGCGEFESECACCDKCDGSGKLPDGSVCTCARCPECGAIDPRESTRKGCSTCTDALGDLARQAEIEGGWDPTS